MLNLGELEVGWEYTFSDIVFLQQEIHNVSGVVCIWGFAFAVIVFLQWC